jgi:hypothetical protein
MPESSQSHSTRLCRRCGRPGGVPTVLPRFRDRPTFHIFDCIGCGYINWVAQDPQVSPPQKTGRATSGALEKVTSLRPPLIVQLCSAQDRLKVLIQNCSRYSTSGDDASATGIPTSDGRRGRAV